MSHKIEEKNNIFELKFSGESTFSDGYHDIYYFVSANSTKEAVTLFKAYLEEIRMEYVMLPEKEPYGHPSEMGRYIHPFDIFTGGFISKEYGDYNSLLLECYSNKYYSLELISVSKLSVLHVNH